MNTFSREAFAIDFNCMNVDTNELRKRLGVDKSFDTSGFDGVLKQASTKIKPKCVYTRVPVTLQEDDICSLGFAVIKSRDLHKNLKGCSQAFVFAVTLGFEADRHLLMLSKTSPSRHFIVDGYYSAAAEAVCNYAEEKIKGKLCCKPRFSPGYGDLPLDIQRDVLQALDAGKLLGISLTASLLMTPQKSITAIAGIINEDGKDCY